MTKCENVIKKDVVAKTIQLVEKRIREFAIEQLEDKIKSGVAVGNYEVASEDGGYAIYESGVALCRGVYSLDVAFSMIQLKLKNSSASLRKYVSADHTYGKCLNDMLVYQHIMDTSNDCTATMIAEDRLNASACKMQEAKMILAKLKTEANAAVFDK